MPQATNTFWVSLEIRLSVLLFKAVGVFLEIYYFTKFFYFYSFLSAESPYNFGVFLYYPSIEFLRTFLASEDSDFVRDLCKESTFLIDTLYFVILVFI